jgi:hypothetical protein
VGALSAAGLLEVWERGRRATAVGRASALLEAAMLDEPIESLPRLTLGERNARLFELRGQLFGPEIPAVANCPACNAAVELVVPPTRFPTNAGSAAASFDVERLACDDYEISFRLPTMADVTGLAPAAGAEAVDAALLERCVVEARIGGEPTTAAELPPDVVDALERRMDELDQRADVRLALSCPDCGVAWLAGFAIADFLWADLDRWARRILAEVHALAGAYGWREADILAMGVARRELYLELIGG